jgi:methylenetetrahydrofolate reductase (NADPH)
MCGAKIPAALYDKYKDNPENHQASIDVASDLCQKLIKGGVGHIHFYTLNRSDLVEAVLKNLSI